MSLKIWLPLNGTLDNKGASNVTVTNNGATIDTAGKIGSCYSFNGNNYYISLVGQDLFNCFKGGTTPFSICMWVFHGDSRRAILFGDYSTSGSIGFNIELSTNHAVRFYWNGNPDYYPNGMNAEASTWHHIAFTYDGTLLSSYLDGALKTTRSGALATLNKTVGEFRLGRDNRTTDTALNGKLNDVRIYDHCLSKAEVHEISQGLVLHYKLDDINGTKIIDSSGYGNNGTIVSTVSYSSNSPRYCSSTNLETGASMIDCGRGGMVTDSITVNLWLNSSTWANPVSCTESGGWNFEASDTCFRFPVYISDVGYKYGKSTTTKAQLCDNNWHMLTGIYDRINQKIQIYVDGKLDNNFATNTSNIIAYHNSNHIWLGGEAKASGASAGMIGLFSDFRIYATPLSADDIFALYKIEAKVDKGGNFHAYEFIEDDEEVITNKGQIEGHNVLESPNPELTHYDKTIYTEPDGSKWVHICHHNNPANGVFTSGSNWKNGVYIDADRWFDVFATAETMFNYEFMVKQKTTSSATEVKYRWVQTVSPLTAVYNDVKPASVTRITTSGYTDGGNGGLYILNGNTYMCIANSNNGNWYGGIGTTSAYQGGIPGYPNTAVTTGYVDLYARIYPNAKIIKDIGFTGNNLIEM